MWFDDKGRVPMCEATCSGHVVEPKIGLCEAVNWHVKDWKG